MGNTGFTLSGGRDIDVTVLSNSFIDNIMPRLNGAYVKVYIYLLRSFNSKRDGLSVSGIADALESTDADVLRALVSLEKYNLVRLIKDESDNITEIRFADTVKAPAEQQSPSVPSFMIKQEEKAPLAPVTQFPVESKEPTETHIPAMTKAQLKEITSNSEIEWIMSTAENYLERLLNPSDTQLIAYLYTEAGFSADLIFYLFEYCATKNKKSSQYIEKVAINWIDQNITTVEQAEKASAKYNEHYIAVSKAFGLDRMPAAAQQDFINKWVNEFHMTDELITEACNRTILATGKPDFKYANGILENWNKKNVKSLKEVVLLDQLHQQTAAKAQPLQKVVNGSNNNKFNAFPQRSYTSEEMASMEQMLLNRQG